MMSHEWAQVLRDTAMVLEAKANVQMGGEPKILNSHYGRKEEFLAVVRALKPGKKRIDAEISGYVNFTPAGTCIEVYINRDVMCRKVKEAEYECEPLLSAEEDAEMEAMTAADQGS